LSTRADPYQDYRAVAKSLGVDAVALVPGPNFMRAINLGLSTNERPKLIVIPQSGPPAAIMPNLELTLFATTGFEGEVFDWFDQTGYDSAFAALASHMPLKSVGVEGQAMRVFVHHALANAFPGIRIVDAERSISQLRLRKTTAEIASLQRAIDISEAALAETLTKVRAGQTEKQVEQMLVQALFGHGADELAFTPIIAAADNSAHSHAHARDNYQIRMGDPLLFDFGAAWGGFNADITRTVFVGEPSREARDVYEVVLAANRAALDVTRPGATAHDVDDAVISVMEASPFADRIVTKTGHGLGRMVHEEPYIMRGNMQVLEPGMIYTDEPGLYKVGAFGVRIEDDILVTAEGCRCLTAFPRELTVIG
jgi:Xaa-Pro dipeptidase